MHTQRQTLVKEYIGYINSVFVWPLRLSGFFRFHATNNEIIDKPISNILRGFLCLFIWNICVCLIAHENSYSPAVEFGILEYTILPLLAFLQNVCVVNILLFHRHSGVELLNSCIDIDVLLGVNETKFMRKALVQSFILFFMLIGTIILVITFAFYCTFHVYNSSLILANLIFVFLLQVLYDACIGVLLFVFIIMRSRYLNLSLIKMAKLNRNYFPKFFLFDGILWREKWNKMVTFHKRADHDDFIKAYKLLFIHLEYAQNRYRFAILMLAIFEVMSIFSLTQLLITYIKKMKVQYFQLSCNFVWILCGAINTLCVTSLFDSTCGELQNTKQICTFILLKPSMPSEIIQLSKKILRVLKTRNASISLYNIFLANSNLLLKLMTTMMIYVIMQFDVELSPKNIDTLVNKNDFNFTDVTSSLALE